MNDPAPPRDEQTAPHHFHARPDITDTVISQWASERADDAGALARKLIACRADTPSAAQVSAPQWDDETCLLFAEGYDREDAAQRGEPSPHDAEGEDYAEWAMDRVACVRAALRALAGEA